MEHPNATLPEKTKPALERFEDFAQRCKLCLPERRNSRVAGDHSGTRAGSSIEFQDRKDYTIGDDVRHIDWRAYARNDRLSIKLYREEIAPRVDILWDTSLSMAVTEDKAKLGAELVNFFRLVSRRTHTRSHVYDLADRLRRLPEGQPPETTYRPQVDPIPLLASSPLSQTAGIKIWISDFLFPFSPEALARCFARSDRLVLIQVLSAFEADPSSTRNVRLEDAETREYLDVALDARTVKEYRRRLTALQEDMKRVLHTSEGALAIVKDTDTVRQAIESLIESRIVETI
jgi:uncharacterized protein (DUF58 family)